MFDFFVSSFMNYNLKTAKKIHLYIILYKLCGYVDLVEMIETTMLVVGILENNLLEIKEKELY